MKTVEETEKKIAEYKEKLAKAEEELQVLKRAAMKSIRNQPCPTCGNLISLSNIPPARGLPQTHGVECEGCQKRWEVKVAFLGGSPYSPGSYNFEWTFRGWTHDNVPVEQLTWTQIEEERAYLRELGDGKVSYQLTREKDLVWEAMKRVDGARGDDVAKRDRSLIDQLKSRLGVQQ